MEKNSTPNIRMPAESPGGSKTAIPFFGEGRPVSSLFIQPKLSVNQPGDAYEQEADATADTVMRMPDAAMSKPGAAMPIPGTIMRMPDTGCSGAGGGPFFKPSSLPAIQRKCAACEEEEHTAVQRKCKNCEEEEHIVRRKDTGDSSPTKGAPQSSTAVDRTLASSGQSLDTGAKTFMEQRFGQDFGHVQIHNDSLAHQSSADIQAKAYTHGNHIAFGAGQYQPQSEAGKHLLAHELTHVIQQGSDRQQPSIQRQADPAPATATAAANGPTPVYTTPQEYGDTNARTLTLPTSQEGSQAITSTITRMLTYCPCKKIPSAKRGFFYNPDVNNLALAFKYCKGQRSLKIFGQLQTDLNDLSNGLKATGNLGASYGSDRVNVDVTGKGTNRDQDTPGGDTTIPNNGVGVGGHAQVLIKTKDGKQGFYVTADYLRLLNTPAGTDQNVGSGGLGFSTDNASYTLQFEHTGGQIPTNTINITIGGSKLDKNDCYTCVCPPLQPHYQCSDLVVTKQEPPKPKTEPVPEPEEVRVYFILDQANLIVADHELAEESRKSLDEIRKRVLAGGTITSITGYASPEATAKHNLGLSKRRADATAKLAQEAAGNLYGQPSVQAGGELLGSQPTPILKKSLTDLLDAEHIESAEEFTKKLRGNEIFGQNLTRQIKSIFNTLSGPPDRTDDKLALFGLTKDSPIAGEVLASITTFLQSKDSDQRPWDHIFARFRAGVIRLSPVPKKAEESPAAQPDKGDTRPVDKEKCDERGKEAEKKGFFGPPPSQTRKPEDMTTECQIEVRNNSELTDCKYETPKENAVDLKPPDEAPIPFQSNSK